MSSSFQDPAAVSEYSRPVLIGVGVVLIVLPVFVVALRFYVRRRTRTGLGPDDYMILFALVCLPFFSSPSSNLLALGLVYSQRHC